MLDTGRPTIVGRDSELRALKEGLAEVMAGHGWLTVIEGEAGLGKTRLLERIAATARTNDFTVLSAGGYEMGRNHSFGVIAEALDLRSSSPDPNRAAIAELLRGSHPGTQNLEFRLLEDILALLETLSNETTNPSTMDDPQWVDSPSLLAVAHVARRLTIPPPWRPTSASEASRKRPSPGSAVPLSRQRPRAQTGCGVAGSCDRAGWLSAPGRQMLEADRALALVWTGAAKEALARVRQLSAGRGLATGAREENASLPDAGTGRAAAGRPGRPALQPQAADAAGRAYVADLRQLLRLLGFIDSPNQRARLHFVVGASRTATHSISTIASGS